jgi:twitching motility protein PilJ
MARREQGLAQVVKLLTALAAVAAALGIAAAAAYFFASRGGDGSTGAQASIALQSLAVQAPRAARGDAEALAGLEAAADRLAAVAARDAGAGWARDARIPRVLANAEAVTSAGESLVAASAAAREARSLGPAMVTELGQIQLAVPGAASAATIARPLERFELSIQRVQLDLAALVAGEVAPAEAARRLAENTDFAGQVVKGLTADDPAAGLPRASGEEAERRAAALAARHQQLAAAVSRAVSAAPALPAAQKAAAALSEDARALAEVAAKAAAGGGVPWWPLVLALATLVPLFILWQRISALRAAAEHQRAVAEAQAREADRNQQAILRLLDELSSLADGDLTVQATVTEDITGAIADSINYAVEALRGLVTTINKSSIQLDSAARQTQALSQHLAKASVAQSKQIAAASESAGAMASNTEEISGNAERASDVARHSVDVAHKGGDAVRRTIDGMNAIRETIQETSKRIKRLGESSQEIGNIVELINDIAEQTNILALNASIQASMAGEAGRGFAVVADEVQRLAERAALATKQIEVLVRTIQSDTNEAVVSMERSTTDVVGGALLAENAGAALEEIEQVSNQIASLVQNISTSSRQQTQVAQSIPRNLQVLREISAQTADSTSANSVAMAKLAELSAGLRKSAAGFRLPGAPDPSQTMRNIPRPVIPDPERKASA